MDRPATFFLLILAAQLVFTGALVAIVARRRPARARPYRFVAPAAVPALALAFVAQNYVQAYRAVGVSLTFGPLGRIALAYLVLWLAGVLWATLVLRIAARR